MSNTPLCSDQISRAIAEMNSPYNDGYMAWGIKQDLLLLKFMLDDVLKDAPDFGKQEAEWMQEQRTKQAIIKLGGTDA